jgi:hypothetical protein
MKCLCWHLICNFLDSVRKKVKATRKAEWSYEGLIYLNSLEPKQYTLYKQLFSFTQPDT